MKKIAQFTLNTLEYIITTYAETVKAFAKLTGMIAEVLFLIMFGVIIPIFVVPALLISHLLN
jgi:ABC-type Na+ efflux pump permease subunit